MTEAKYPSTRPRKGLIIILDGLGDRPAPDLDGITPLEAARTPTMDALIANGRGGMVSPAGHFFPVGTQVGTGILMGLSVETALKMGRGMIEAAGAGISLSDNSIALRANLATLKKIGESYEIVDRRAGRISEESAELSQALDGLKIDNVEIVVRPSSQHRLVVVLKGPGLSAHISDTDPGAGRGYVGVLKSKPTKDTASARRTSAVVNQLTDAAYEVLKGHRLNIKRKNEHLLPATGLLLRGSSTNREFTNIITSLGIPTGVVTGEGTVRGLGRSFGFDVTMKPEFTATPETDLASKIKSTMWSLEKHDLVYLHIKGTDTSAHDFNPKAKRDFISAIDAAIAPLMSEDLVIGITGDHSTDSNSGRHTGDPVPTIIYAKNARVDHLTSYSEMACMQGGLGTITGSDFLCTILDHMNELPNYRPRHLPFYR